MRPPRPLVALLALSLALSVGACNKQAQVTHGETEGTYLDVGPMKYQVQISRQLNPSIPEDRGFLGGLAPGDARISSGDAWFAVFVRVENDTSRPQPLATDYAIADTDGNSYRPLTIGKSNPFAYGTAPLAAHSVAPGPDSVAGQVSIRGMELLFKIKRASLDNRPLELTIKSPAVPQVEASVTLDV